MSEDGLSASAGPAESVAGIDPALDAGLAVDKSQRRAKRQNGHANGQHVNGQSGTAPRRVSAVRTAEVVWKHEAFRGLDLKAISGGFLLDLNACHRARLYLRNPVDDPPNLTFTYTMKTTEDGRTGPVPAQAFAGGSCPIVLSVLREPGDTPDLSQDEFKIGWAGGPVRSGDPTATPDLGRWLVRPQRCRTKALKEFDLAHKLLAPIGLRSELGLMVKACMAQATDVQHSPLIELPAPGLVCETGSWVYGFPYSEMNPGDNRNPARRLYAELDKATKRFVLRNAAGGAPTPIHPMTQDRLGLFGDFLAGWDQEGRALATFCYGARSLCAGIARLRYCLLLLGGSEHGKTTATRYTGQCASPMGSPEFRLAGEGGTANALDDCFRRYRDCFFVADDKIDNNAEVVRICVSLLSAVHEAGPRRRRMKRDISAGEAAYPECGVAITAENADGLRQSRQRRAAVLLFDKPPVNAAGFSQFARQLLGKVPPGEDFNSLSEAGLPAGREAMQGVVHYVLQRLQTATDKALDAGAIPEVAEQEARLEFAGLLEMRCRQIAGQLLTKLQRLCPGQKFLKSVAESFAEIWLGAYLADRGAGFSKPLDLDAPVLGPMTSRLRRYIIDLAVRGAGVINGQIAVDTNIMAGRFPLHLKRLLAAGRWGLVGADGGVPNIKDVPPDAVGWVRDLDMEKRNSPPRPPSQASEWRKPLRFFGYQKGNEIWIERHNFGALAEIKDAEIDYERLDMVLPQLREAGILICGDGKHLTLNRRLNGKLKRFIVIRADRVWLPDAKAKVKQDVGGPDGTAPTAPVSPATAPAEAAPAEAMTPARAVAAVPISQPVKAAARPTPVSAQGLAIAVIGADSGYRIDRAGKIASVDVPPSDAPLSALLDWCEREQIEQLSLEGSWCTAAGLPTEWQDGDGLVRRCLTHEGLAHTWASVPEGGRWRISHPGELHWSIWAHRNGGSARNPIEIIFPGYDDRSALHQAPDAETLTCALAEFRTAMASDNGRAGFAYRGGPAETFMGIWRSLASDRGAADIAPDLAPADFPPPARPLEDSPTRYVAGNVYWARRPTAEEASATFAFVLDKNGMFPGAMSGLRCGIGGLQRVQAPIAFDKNAPGWWLVRYEAPDWPRNLPPPGGLLAPGLTGWLETTTVALLFEIGAKVDIADAWVWASSTRALDRLQHKLRDARTQLMTRRDDAALSDVVRNGASIALDTLKSCIVRGIGWFDRRSDRSRTEIVPRYRPHWRDGIMARATANLFRDAVRAGERSGLYPVGVYVDALVYLTDQPDASSLVAKLGLPLGTAFGQYKVASIVPAEKIMPALCKLSDADASALTPAQRKARREVFEAIDNSKRGEAEVERDA